MPRSAGASTFAPSLQHQKTNHAAAGHIRGPPLPALILGRAAAGLLVAAAIALVARRAGSLSTSGAIAATVVGTAAVAAGWRWGALLILYFATSSLLSRLGAAEKERRTQRIVAKMGERDALQVLANGGLFAMLALAASAAPGEIGTHVTAAALGALAASAADTWATEIGTLVGRQPRSLLTLRTVPSGTSGAVSMAGSAAMLAGALFVAVAARAIGLTDAVGAVAAGGVAGAMADSVLGAIAQERRWCASCELATERRVHDCGAATRLAGGVEWMDNDVVNLLATLVGAAAAGVLG